VEAEVVEAEGEDERATADSDIAVDKPSGGLNCERTICMPLEGLLLAL
jgi:hypothetical protein